VSFLLDPPSLFLCGALVYYFTKKLHFKRLWIINSGVAITGLFIGISLFLYFDIIRWQIPYIMDMKGSTWMFHTDLTGINKGDVPLIFAMIMFVLYPLWYYLGFIATQYYFKKQQMSDKKVYTLSDVKCRDKPTPEDFTIKRGGDSRELLRDCISELGGINKIVEQGDRVIIKANICGGNPKIPGSFASIEVVDELVKVIQNAGGTPVVVDADMIWTEFWQVAIEEGYHKWSKQNKIELLNLSESKLAKFDFGGTLKKTTVSKELINADVIISIPTMKTHILTGVTLGMKNMYGTFPQMDKAVYHQLGIEEVIYEVNNAFPPTLTIIDGSIGGEAMGPLSSKPVNFETLIASRNVVVADAIASKLIGYDPLEIEHIRLAHEAGLGNAKVEVDLDSLSPHKMDGIWEKPSIEVTQFYNDVIKTMLQYPSIDIFFNLLADFMFYDAATLPIFKDLTPTLLVTLNDVFDSLHRSGRVINWKIPKLLPFHNP